MSSAGQPALPWRKVLWDTQPFPDNAGAVRESPLACEAAADFDTLSLVLDSLPVAQQLSTVALYCVAYIHCYEGRLSAQALILMQGLLLGAVAGRSILVQPELAAAKARRRALFIASARHFDTLARHF
jgi:hypothetical protein